MQKVAVLFQGSLREQILDALQEQGVLQIVETPTAGVIDHTEVNFRAAELQFAINTLKDIATKEALQTLVKTPTPAQVIASVQKTDVRGIVDTLSALEEDDTTARRTLEELQQRRTLLQPWQRMRERLDAPAQTALVVRRFGMVPASRIQAVHAVSQEAGFPADLEVFDESNGMYAVAATVLAHKKDAFEERVTALGWTDVQLPTLAGTPGDILGADLEEEGRLQALLRQNRQKRHTLSFELSALRNVQLFLGWLHDKQAAREALVERFATNTLFGWVPRHGVSALEVALAKVSPAVAVLRVKSDPEDEPPVHLKNSFLITPFESVTTLYGLPLSSEMDPTAPLSPFFALYFALCLTDGGYGLALALIFGIILLVKKPTPKEATLPWLLFFSGIASVIVGIPFGGWFGLSPDQAPAFLTVVRDDGSRWFLGQVWNLSTQEGINFLQYLSLALGITHIFFGVFLAGWFKWVHAAKAEAFWVHFTSHLLLGSALFYGFAPAHMSTIALWTLSVALALNIWGKGYGSAWYIRPVMGVLGLVNFAIGLLSNSLSYLRILALGLVTGAIALAINQVAIQMSALFPPILGIPVLIVIAFAGHLVSIALNTLGAFIHSGRLQFIEFFGQFFEGGGRPYSPFRRSLQ